MRCLVILLIFCLLQQTIGRPQAVTQENYKDAEEAEYDDDEESEQEDSPHEDEDAAVDEKFSEFPAGRRGQDDEAVENGQDQPEINSRRDRYSETNNANNQFIQESDNQEERGAYRSQQLNKGRANAEQDDNNDMFYENGGVKPEAVKKFDKNKGNYENAVTAGQTHFYHRYYNRPTKFKESEENSREEFNHDDSSRDRRDADDPTDDGTNQDKDKKDFGNFENEAEQAIIQRYIKKLNKKEVEELMSTLSDDKRALLEQIINDGETNQPMNLNKREITKKAGAVAENNLMDGVQSDSNTISGPLINLNIGDSISQNNDATGITTARDEDLSTTKTDDNKINRRSTGPDEVAVTEKSEMSTVTTATESATGKCESKREVNVNDFNNKGSPGNDFNNAESQEAPISDLQDEFYTGNQDDDMTQLMDADVQLHYDDHNPQKRDLMLENNAEMAEPMKSLQESFSNSNSYEESGYYGGSNMVPLIRVKRRNNEHAVKKRAAAILPESKVAYVPENEDADNDEGDEFYDDSFFDRTANFAKSNSRVNKLSDSRLFKLNTGGNQSVYKRSNALTNDAGKDTMSIGSDTDILSGVGVDENLMYRGGSRKKRAADKSPKLEPAEELIHNDMFTSSQRSSSAVDNGRPEGYGVSYSGDEAFGQLSKSCEGELSRYKRIRRLKQSADKGFSSTEETAN